VKAIVSSNLIPYNVPHKIDVQCITSTKKHDIHNNGNIPTEKEITIPEKRLPEFVDLSYGVRRKILTSLAGGYFSADCKVSMTEIESITINKMKIRPIMHNLITDGKKFLNDKGNKYNSYDIFVIQKDADNNLTAGKEIEIIGYVIADPKNSKITIMAVIVKELDGKKFDLEKIREIQKFHKNKNTNEIINWYTKEFSKYSKIVKRDNIIIGTVLNMFSSLGFEFENEVVRGWINVTIIGDTTTAKSKTVKETIKPFFTPRNVRVLSDFIFCASSFIISTSWYSANTLPNYPKYFLPYWNKPIQRKSVSKSRKKDTKTSKMIQTTH